ncbi:hypothetical protein [Mycolicibacterium xanthum]|uniref:hypothetical protein n=1 Tax=Mycolicibacterium xanthum TaxID=2796469 RepID=UPI0027DF8A84|nr:hypothetical protein [Mycolicibacterium xanthum]
MLSALLAAFFLPLYLGSVPLPVSAVLSGVVNAALVWTGLQWTPSQAAAGTPLWTWLATVALFTLGGPGEDIVFGGAGIMEYGAVLLVALGAGPAALVLTRQTGAHSGRGTG